MKSVFGFLKYMFYSVLSTAFFGIVIVFLIFHFFSDDLPDHSFLRGYSPNISSRVFLRDGRRLCEYSHEKRYFIPLDKIPNKLSNAFIAAEDKHFYDHIGIDVIGIMRSALKNLKNLGTGKRPQGASTITQQVARIFLIKNNEISYVRKVKEAILSLRMEASLSKQKILELYLNQIYMGMGVYGVATAAKAYFDKTVDELTLAECSYLAALAKGANNYHPIRNREKAIIRRNWVIDRQLEDGYITDQEAEEAKREDLLVAEQGYNITNAEYFSEEIRKWLLDKFPVDSLNKDGFIIRATLDTTLQQYAYEALRAGLVKIDRNFGWRGPICKIEISENKRKVAAVLKEIKKPRGGEELKIAVVTFKKNQKIHVLTEDEIVGEIIEEDSKWMGKNVVPGMVILVSNYLENNELSKKFRAVQIPEIQGAIVVIDVHFGRILAMQGGYSFHQSEFNRVTQAMRQSGSAFKPFVYLTALDNGFAPNAIIDSSSVEVDLGEVLGVWKPKNYNDVTIDKVTFRRALERSINTATVRIAQEVGIGKVARLAENFGIFNKMPEYLSYTLGAGETTLLRLTAAYAMLANGGKRITPTMVDYVLDRFGNVMYRNDMRTIDNEIGFDAEYPPKLNDNRSQIIDERSVYQITSILEGTLQRIPGFLKKFPNCSIAGKTGTSNDSRDTWFIGYTPDIVVGVFVGFDDQTKNLGKYATGYTTAFPIFCDFISRAKTNFTPKPFRIPKGIKLRKIDLESGGNPINSEKSITEAFKEDDEGANSIIETKKRRSIIELINNDDSHNDDDENDFKKIKPILGIY